MKSVAIETIEGLGCLALSNDDDEMINDYHQEYWNEIQSDLL